jgi:hypothetical protein
MGVGRSGAGSRVTRRKSLVLSRNIHSLSLVAGLEETVLSGRGVCSLLSIALSSFLVLLVFSSVLDEE